MAERGIKISKNKYKYYFQDWLRISSFENLPEDFIRKYEKKVNWLIISLSQKNMSDEFIYEYRNKLNLEILVTKEVITKKRLEAIEFLRRKEISRFELMEL